MDLFETTLRELYQSTVEAFPKTTKRQHSTNEIIITKLEWVPFIAMKTLRVKGLAQNKGNGHEYSPIILFKQVVYHPQRERGVIEIIDNMGQTYFLEKLQQDDTQILVSCGCNDFRWRGQHWDKVEKCLLGRDRKKYEAKYNPGSANPDEAPMLCKHLMKLSKTLSGSGILW